MALAPVVLPDVFKSDVFKPSRGFPDFSAPDPTVIYVDTQEARTMGMDLAQELKDDVIMRQDSGYDSRLQTPVSLQKILMMQGAVLDRPKVASTEAQQTIADIRSDLERQFGSPSPPPPPPGRGGNGGNGGDGEDDVTMKQLSEAEAKLMLDAWIGVDKVQGRRFISASQRMGHVSSRGLTAVRSFVDDLPNPVHGTLDSSLKHPVSEESQKIVVALYASPSTWYDLASEQLPEEYGGPVLALAAGYQPGIVHPNHQPTLDIKHVLVSPFVYFPQDSVALSKMRAQLIAVTQHLSLNLKLPDVDGV